MVVCQEKGGGSGSNCNWDIKWRREEHREIQRGKGGDGKTTVLEVKKVPMRKLGRKKKGKTGPSTNRN